MLLNFGSSLNQTGGCWVRSVNTVPLYYAAPNFFFRPMGKIPPVTDIAQIPGGRSHQRFSEFLEPDP